MRCRPQSLRWHANGRRVPMLPKPPRSTSTGMAAVSEGTTGRRCGRLEQARHADVMRAAKAGVPFTAPAAAPAGTSAEDLLPVAAKRDEDDRSEELHHALVRRFGQSLYEQWYARVALVFTDCGLTVVSPSAFHASWLENHHKADIDAALGKIGRGVDWIAFRVDRKGGKAAVKAARSGGRKRAR